MRAWIQRRRAQYRKRAFLRVAVKDLNRKRGGAPIRSDPYALRRLNDGALAQVVLESYTPVEKALAEAEQRRRDAWRAPAGRAFWISILSLGVAAAALFVSIAGKP